MSFLNAPSETEKQLLNDFIDQFGDIEYLTGTRVYRVSNIITPIPLCNKLFGGGLVKCIYTGQPEDSDEYSDDDENKTTTMNLNQKRRTEIK